MKETADMAAAVRAYCDEHGLDPQLISGTMRRTATGWTVTGHQVLERPLLPTERCCCGSDPCDGGLRERGIDPAELTSHQAVVPLGVVDCE